MCLGVLRCAVCRGVPGGVPGGVSKCAEVCWGVLRCYIYMDISSYLMLSIKVKLSKHNINSNIFSCFKLLVKTAHSLTLWRIKLTTRNQNTNCPSLNILIIWFNFNQSKSYISLFSFFGKYMDISSYLMLSKKYKLKF